MDLLVDAITIFMAGEKKPPVAEVVVVSIDCFVGIDGGVLLAWNKEDSDTDTV